MWEAPHAAGQRPLDSRGGLQPWVWDTWLCCVHFTDPVVHEGPWDRTFWDVASQASALGSRGAPVCRFRGVEGEGLHGSHTLGCAWLLVHMVGRGHRISLLGRCPL